MSDVLCLARDTLQLKNWCYYKYIIGDMTMAKQIMYDPKITQARTQYNTIDPTDMLWLQTEFIRYIALMGELSNVKDNEDIDHAVRGYWRKKSKTLPKGRYGQNSPETFISGLLNNLMFGTQNDLSSTQMDALQNISLHMNMIYKFVKNLNLQPNTSELEIIQFRQKLFDL